MGIGKSGDGHEGNDKNIYQGQLGPEAMLQIGSLAGQNKELQKQVDRNSDRQILVSNTVSIATFIAIAAVAVLTPVPPTGPWRLLGEEGLLLTVGVLSVVIIKKVAGRKEKKLKAQQAENGERARNIIYASGGSSFMTLRDLTVQAILQLRAFKISETEETEEILKRLAALKGALAKLDTGREQCQSGYLSATNARHFAIELGDALHYVREAIDAISTKSLTNYAMKDFRRRTARWANTLEGLDASMEAFGTASADTLWRELENRVQRR